LQDNVKCMNLRFSNDLYDCVFNIWQRDIPSYIAWQDKKEYPLPQKEEWILIACDSYDIDSQYQGKYVMLAQCESNPRREKRDPEGKKTGIHLTGHIFLPHPVDIIPTMKKGFWNELSMPDAQEILRQGDLHGFTFSQSFNK